MKLRNKRGVVGMGMTGLVSLFLLFLLSVVFLALVVLATGVKGPSVPGSVSGFDESSVLFKEVDVEGESMSFVRGLIKADLGGDEFYEGKVKEGIIERMKRDSLEKGEDICFIMCEGCGKLRSLIQPSRNERGYSVMVEGGEFNGGSDLNSPLYGGLYQEAGLSEDIGFLVRAEDFEKEYKLVYYYGKCFSDEELRFLSGGAG